MTNRRGAALRGWLLAVLVTIAPTRASAADQTGAPPLSVQAKLTRIAADLFTKPERLDEAIRELQAILAIDPQSAEAHMLLGNAYVGKGLPALKGEAIAEFRQALQLNPRLVAARFYLAGVYLDLGRAGMARDELQAALLEAPGQPQFLASLGEAERRLGNPKRAAEILRHALQGDPSSGEARYSLARALLDLGQRDEGIRELEQVAQSDPDVLEVVLTLGTAYLEAGRAESALGALTRAASMAPARPDIRILLARAYREKGLIADAERQLALVRIDREAMVQNPGFYQQVEIGLMLEQALIRMQQGRLSEATSALERALKLDPTHGPTHRALAEAYLRQGMYARSLGHAKEAEALGAPLPAALRQQLDGKVRSGRTSPGR